MHSLINTWWLGREFVFELSVFPTCVQVLTVASPIFTCPRIGNDLTAGICMYLLKHEKCSCEKNNGTCRRRVLVSEPGSELFCSRGTTVVWVIL